MRDLFFLFVRLFDCVLHTINSPFTRRSIESMLNKLNVFYLFLFIFHFIHSLSTCVLIECIIINYQFYIHFIVLDYSYQCSASAFASTADEGACSGCCPCNEQQLCNFFFGFVPKRLSLSSATRNLLNRPYYGNLIKL